MTSSHSHPPLNLPLTSDEYLKDQDRLRQGFLTRTQLGRALSRCGIRMTDTECEALSNLFPVADKVDTQGKLWLVDVGEAEGEHGGHTMNGIGASSLVCLPTNLLTRFVIIIIFVGRLLVQYPALLDEIEKVFNVKGLERTPQLPVSTYYYITHKLSTYPFREPPHDTERLLLHLGIYLGASIGRASE